MAPKSYLCCSIRGGRSEGVPYNRLTQLLGEHCQVLNPFVTDNPSESKMEGDTLTDEAIHTRDMKLLKECDVLVAEVSHPSFGVGYEVGRAVELKKPVLCIHMPDAPHKVSAMIGWAGQEPTGAPVQLKPYTGEDDLRSAFKEYFTAFAASNARKSSIDWKSYEPM